MINAQIIGNRIADARKRLNISQAQLAQRLFISPQAVGKWERGESMPDIITLNRLTEILEVDLNYFFDGATPVSTAEGSVGSAVQPSAELRPEVQSTSDKPEKKLSWDMSGGNWVDADFSGLENLHEKFSGSNMQRCKFTSSDLSGLLLKSNNVDSCDFSGSNINNSRIQKSNLLNNVFKACLLKEAEFSGSNIDSCDFSGANFTGTVFTKSFIYGCDLSGVDFTRAVIKSGGFSGVVKSSEANTITSAVLNNTSFIGTHIADIVFACALEDCYFENCGLTRVKFHNATLVNTFFKNNKNLKKVQFIDCKADRITYEFLKQGNADLSGITLLDHEKEGGNHVTK